MKNSQNGFAFPLVLILVALLLAGGGAYVYEKNKQVNQPAAEIIKVSSQDIKNAFIRKYPTRDYSTASITIDKNSNNLFVDGGISGGAVGAHYWAAKVNGVWTIVFDGQEFPACSVLNNYNFPKDMTSGCY